MIQQFLDQIDEHKWLNDLKCRVLRSPSVPDPWKKKMKTTQYFTYTRKRPDRVNIKDYWIMHVIDNPVKTETQSDGRVKKWAKIQEANKYLRVILLENGETVHNAFFDSSSKGD